MPILEMQRQNMMRDYVTRAKAINNTWGGISAKKEYIGFVGSYYNQLQTGTKNNKPIYKTSSKGLSQIDKMAAQRMFVAGYPKNKITAQILKNSPACRGMPRNQKIGYARQLEGSMQKVKCDRLMNRVSKIAYGINTNRIRDIDDYKACKFYARQAKQKGLGIGKPPSYRQFAKNPALGQNYLNRFEPNRYPKMDASKPKKLQNRSAALNNKQQTLTQKRNTSRKPPR